MTFLLGFLGIGKTVLGFLKSLPWQVYAILGGILALLFLWHVHTGWEKDAYNAAFNAGWNKQKVLTDAEIAKNTINLRSIGKLTQAIADQNADVQRRAKAFDDSKAANAATIADMDRRAVSSDARRSRLEAIARAPGGNEACRAPKALTDSLEGL